MKNFIKVLVLAIAAVFMFAGSAMAYTITYMDNTKNWPGYFISSSDEIGTPQIKSLSITIDDTTNYLKSIIINEANRRVWDSLFINNDNEASWDFYVRDDSLTETSPTNAILYTVNYTGDPKLTYTFAPSGRTGHPNGIQDKYLIADNTGLLISLIWNSTDNTLTYLFNDGIDMSHGFNIGYTPWCANDVILTPEPGILMLLGFGILGLAGFRRRVKK